MGGVRRDEREATAQAIAAAAVEVAETPEAYEPAPQVGPTVAPTAAPGRYPVDALRVSGCEALGCAPRLSLEAPHRLGRAYPCGETGIHGT